jgi:signal transduction histidine kinase
MTLFSPAQPDEPRFSELLRPIQSIAIALIALDGTVEDANLGFWRLAGLEQAPVSAWNAAELFVQPAFTELATSWQNQASRILFEGILNFGIAGTVPISLIGKVHRHPRGLLVCAEHEIEALHKLKDTVLALNQELAETQRHLVRDIQARRRAEKALEETNRGIRVLYAELEEKALALKLASDQKTRFLSHMTHELRSPLAAILNLAHLLLNRVDGDLTPGQETQARFIHKSARVLVELVNDQLDLAKIEAGKTTIRPAVFEVKDVFAALRGMLRPLLRSDATELIFNDASCLPAMYSDQGKIAQILRNLIVNAIKFTPHGTIQVSASCANEKMVFVVADSGVGISPADQKRIFEEFTQLDAQEQNEIKGSGLGLPLSQRLAQLLGGGITLRSMPGEGSQFSVSLAREYREPDTS